MVRAKRHASACGMLVGPVRGRTPVKKGALLHEALVKRGGCGLRAVGGSRAEQVAYGRFLGSEHVRPARIFGVACARTRACAQGRHVLVLQDTSELNYQHHGERVRGLGPAGNGSDRGLFVHPALAVETGTGAVLGLAGGKVWSREEGGAARHRKKRAVEDKESYRWIEVAEQAGKTLKSAAHVTFVSDRESDMFELWSRIPDPRSDLLVRASRDRRLACASRLFEVAQGWRVRDRRVLDIRAQPGRSARTATVALKFGRVRILRPACCMDPHAPEEVSLTCVELRETGGRRKDPIHWRLLTTHKVESVEDAWRIVEWYRMRWHIEQFFRALKGQGLDAGDSQLADGHALLNLAAMAMTAAVSILQLVNERDGKLGRPASDVLDPELYPLAETIRKQREGRTGQQKCPHTHGTLAWLAWVIARLGGWKGYKSERPPGPKTMARGWRLFNAMADGWKLAQGA